MRFGSFQRTRVILPNPWNLNPSWIAEDIEKQYFPSVQVIYFLIEPRGARVFYSFLSSIRITCISKQMIPHYKYKLETATAVDRVLQLGKDEVQVWIPKNTIFTKMLHFREHSVETSL